MMLSNSDLEVIGSSSFCLSDYYLLNIWKSNKIYPIDKRNEIITTIICVIFSLLYKFQNYVTNAETKIYIIISFGIFISSFSKYSIKSILEQNI